MGLPIRAGDVKLAPGDHREAVVTVRPCSHPAPPTTPLKAAGPVKVEVTLTHTHLPMASIQLNTHPPTVGIHLLPTKGAIILILPRGGKADTLPHREVKAGILTLREVREGTHPHKEVREASLTLREDREATQTLRAVKEDTLPHKEAQMGGVAHSGRSQPGARGVTAEDRGMGSRKGVGCLASRLI